MVSPLVSIIIPVYNAETTIGAALDSCLRQDYHNFEVLIVDDGSTDSSLTIAGGYAPKDTRIKCFGLQHQGVVEARAFGVEHSCGKYLFFMDADDLLPANTLDKMVTAIDESTDLVIGDILQIEPSERTTVINYGSNQVHRGKVLFDWIARQRIGFLWGKLINRKLWERLRVMPHGVTFCEDLLLMLQLSYCAQNVRKVEGIVYHYIQHRQSQCNKPVTRGVYAVRFSVLCRSILQLLDSGIFDEDAQIRLKNLFLYYCRLYLWVDGQWGNEKDLRDACDQFVHLPEVKRYGLQTDWRRWQMLVLTRRFYRLLSPIYCLLLKYKYHRIS